MILYTCVVFQSAKVPFASTEKSTETLKTTEAPETGKTNQKHVSPLILILVICQHDIWIYCFTMKTISPQNIFLKPEPSTEVSAETVKTTKAPETAEATPGRFSFFGFHFGTVAAFAFVSMFKVWESPAQLPSQFLDRFSCWLTSSASPCSAAEGEPKYSKLDFDFCAKIFKRISHS